MKYLDRSLYTLFLSALLFACVEEPEMGTAVKNAVAPEVVTLIDEEHPVELQATSITFRAEVLDAGGLPVERYGACWSTSPNPEVGTADTTVCGSGVSAFQAVARNLKPNTLYYIRPYAVNEAGVGYGEEFQKNTTQGLGMMKTFVVDSMVFAESVVCGGKIIDPGEGEILERGVYLARKGSSERDTIPFEMKADSFYQQIKGLDPEVAYEVESYLINTFGTITGGVKTFTTTSGKAKVARLDTVSISFTEAVFSAVLEETGDSAVTSVGFCYGTEKTPDLKSSVVKAGLQPDGSFSAALPGLDPQSQYYVRAFAINHYGTVYTEGDGLPFVLKNQKPTVELKEPAIGMDGTLDLQATILAEGMSEVTAAGFCWSTTETPSLENKKGDSVNVYKAGETALTATLDNLRGGTVYYVAAYATNQSGTAYSKAVQVETPAIFVSKAAAPGEPMDAFSVALASVGTTLYVLGGNTQDSQMSDVFMRYSASGNRWNTRSSFPFKRKWQSLAAYSSSSLFAFGGMGEDGKLTNDLYVYRPSSDIWQKVEPAIATQGTSGLPSAVCNAITFVDNFNVYFMGGRSISSTGEKTLDEIWAFNTLSSVWLQAGKLPGGQYGGLALELDNRVYVGLGKLAKSNVTEDIVYDTHWWSSPIGEANFSWAEETKFPASGVLCGTVFRGVIYVLDTEGYLWSYETEGKVWTRKSQVPEDVRSATNMFATSSYIYLNTVSGSKSTYAYDPVWDREIPWE